MGFATIDPHTAVRQRLSHTTVKANATIPIGIISKIGTNNSLAFLD